jgi:hypothetical protein
MIHKAVAVAILRDGDLGLTRVQIAAIMSEISIDKHDNLDYVALSAAAAGVLSSLTNVEAQRALADQVEASREQEGYGLVFGMGQEQVRELLDGAFRAADADGSGLLPVQTVAEVAVAQLPLDGPQLQAVMSLAAPDDDGNVWYDDVSDWAFHTLEYLASGQHAVLSPRD